MTQDPPVVDEGESQGADIATHDPAGVAPDEPQPLSRRQRLGRAIRVYRGKDVRFAAVQDPEQFIRNQRERQTNTFRLVYAPVLLTLMCVQIAFADYFFWRYAQEAQWDLEPSVVIAFLSSVVVEVIAAVLVVTRALFGTSS